MHRLLGPSSTIDLLHDLLSTTFTSKLDEPPPPHSVTRSPLHRRTPSLLHDLLFTGTSRELDEPPPHSVTIDLLHQRHIFPKISALYHLHDLQGLLNEPPLLHSTASSSVSPA
jgi:hypothetical protein